MMSKALKNLFTNQETRHLALRVLKEHVLPYRGRFLIAIFFMILAAAANSFIPFLLKPVFDDIFVRGDETLLWLICFAVFAALTLRGVASYGESVTMANLGQRIVCDVQNRMFHHLMKADLAFFHRTPSGELISRFNHDISQMRSSVSNAVVGLGKDSFGLIFLVALMFYRDWFLACIAFLVLPLLVHPISKIGKKIRNVTGNTQGELAKLTSHLSQVFLGVRTIKAYNREDYETKRVQDLTQRILNLFTKASRIRSASHPIVEILAGITATAVIAYGGWQVIHGARTAGDFISFTGALFLTYEPIKRLSNLNATLQEGLAAAMRVFKLIDLPITIHDTPQAQNMEKIEGGIEFRHVNFRYLPERKALDNLTFTVAPGETVAFVGSSGSGKSTLINLIPRFYEAESGKILIDGLPLAHFTLHSLRQHVALVSQEITLFNETVLANIAYGNLQANEAEIIASAKAAAAHEFIEQLPQGYHTIIGENGVKLSGGQRQRLAIARAMLKNARILLLDEATSALDTHSERQVKDALNTLMQGRTTLVVAHRLSTITHADQIHVLENGKIIESGKHEELLDKNGAYAHLWRAQLHQIQEEAA
jgi:ATP-binding cassette, subfamily B, bacterial MsbA